MRNRSNILIWLLWLISGCGEDIPVTTSRSLGPAGTALKATKTDGDEADGDEAGEFRFGEDDFIETQGNRDPFRSFMDAFVSKLVSTPQRAVVMSTASIDEMRLVALVNAASEDYAMVVDSAGVGYTLRRGDYVGRSEVIQVGGAEGVPVTLNWRVDRIRPDALVLSREDPMGPNKPPLIKAIPLHDTTASQGQRSGK